MVQNCSKSTFVALGHHLPFISDAFQCKIAVTIWFQPSFNNNLDKSPCHQINSIITLPYLIRPLFLCENKKIYNKQNFICDYFLQSTGQWHILCFDLENTNTSRIKGWLHHRKEMQSLWHSILQRDPWLCVILITSFGEAFTLRPLLSWFWFDSS